MGLMVAISWSYCQEPRSKPPHPPPPLTEASFNTALAFHYIGLYCNVQCASTHSSVHLSKKLGERIAAITPPWTNAVMTNAPTHASFQPQSSPCCAETDAPNSIQVSKQFTGLKLELCSHQLLAAFAEARLAEVLFVVQKRGTLRCSAFHTAVKACCLSRW